MLGSEHISPVSSAANYPPSVAASAVDDTSMQPTDAEEDTATDVAAEPATYGPPMDIEKELLPTDAENDDSDAEQPVSDKQGKLLH